MEKYCVGYELKTYESKTGQIKSMCILNCLVDDDRVTGKAIEKVIVFDNNAIKKINGNVINRIVDIDYRINGTHAFVKDINVVKE